MTFRHRLDNKYLQHSRPSVSPNFPFLPALLLILVAAAIPPQIAQAADEPATVQSVSASDLSLQGDSINWFRDLNAAARPRPDFSPTVESINRQVTDARALNENEFLPVSSTANTANASSPIFKTERWRTNKAVIAASIYEAAWLTADGITTAGMRRGATEVGSTWAYGRHPTPGRTSAMMAAEFMGVEASSYMLHKMKAPKWVYLAPMIVSGSLHASGAIPNLKIGQ
jgi:hypothetical protein